MDNLKIFDYKGNNVRTMQINNETWFVLKDVCEVLGLTNTSVVANRLDYDEVTKFDLGGLSGEINIINESGFYNVILRSDKPEAKKFKKWVTSDVLPSIRNHGIYARQDILEKAFEDPEFLIDMLTNIQKEKAKRKEAEKQLAEKTLQLDENKEWFTVKRIANLTNRPWKFFNWRLLKNASEYMGYEVKKVFDANYGHVNAYHINVWKQEYGDSINI